MFNVVQTRNHGLLLNVVVRKSATVLKLIAGKDETLLVQGNVLFVLEIGCQVVDRSQRFACHHGDVKLKKEETKKARTKNGRLLRMLLAGEDEASLVQRNDFSNRDPARHRAAAGGHVQERAAGAVMRPCGVAHLRPHCDCVEYDAWRPHEAGITAAEVTAEVGAILKQNVDTLRHVAAHIIKGLQRYAEWKQSQAVGRTRAAGTGSGAGNRQGQWAAGSMRAASVREHAAGVGTGSGDAVGTDLGSRERTGQDSGGGQRGWGIGARPATRGQGKSSDVKTEPTHTPMCAGGAEHWRSENGCEAGNEGAGVKTEPAHAPMGVAQSVRMGSERAVAGTKHAAGTGSRERAVVTETGDERAVGRTKDERGHRAARDEQGQQVTSGGGQGQRGGGGVTIVRERFEPGSDVWVMSGAVGGHGQWMADDERGRR
ncbi:hypothetical protein GGX14DRAFT_390704 [Mycena pura]|uniref:Uncharacterized protein n=1 Tax=Mycena pura TaxID=153505 RepID=A0AAD6YK23_9AGAR|nr:hypothetical protein GGX14DRAFT_390704 [Mycena pura]